MSTETIVTKLPVKTLNEIEDWSEREGTEKSIFLTELIDEGLHEWKMRDFLPASRYRASCFNHGGFHVHRR